jgi:hypothetical protein
MLRRKRILTTTLQEFLGRIEDEAPQERTLTCLAACLLGLEEVGDSGDLLSLGGGVIGVSP